MPNFIGSSSNFDNSYKAMSDMVEQNNQQQAGMHQMNDMEKIFAGAANIGQAMANSSGFGQYYQDNGGLASLLTPEGMIRFGMNLPAGMASALPSGFANLYAAATGSNVTYGADVNRGLISDEKLDSGQRAASAVTGLIDTLGLAMGGSGSLINEMGRAWKAGKSIEAAANTGAGARALGISGSGFLNRGMMTTGQAIGFDMAEEAGEEFVQSLSEDVIQKQLDDGSLGRAFEGAVMGALGGGMMSGGAMALRSATNSDIEKAKTSQKTGDGTTDAYNAFNELRMANDSWQSIFTPEAAREASEQRILKEYTDVVPGSISSTCLNSGTVLNPDDVVPGIKELRHIWIQSKDVEDQLLAFFNAGEENNETFVSRDDLKSYIFAKDAVAGAKALNSILDKAYGNRSRRVMFLRNPATTNGAVWVNVARIGAGDGFDMSGYLMQVLGGDFDGDRCAMFFDYRKSQYKPMMWASELAYGVEPGNSPVDWSFTNLVYRENDSVEEDIKVSIRAKLRALSDRSGKVLSNSMIDEISNNLVAAYRAYNENGERIDEDTRGANISAALRSAIDTIGDSYQKAFPGSDITGNKRTALNDIIGAFYGKKTDPIAVAQDEVQKAITGLHKILQGESDFAAVSGSTGAFGTAAAGYQAGIPGHFTDSDLQGFFRNYGTMLFEYVKQHPTEIGVSGENEEDVMSAFGRLVLLSCHVVGAGQDPVKSVTRLIDGMITQQFYSIWQKTNNSFATMTPGERANMLQAFESAYNENVKLYNKCMEVIIDGGYTENYLAPTRKEIDLKTDSGRIAFGGAFIRIFANDEISRFVPETMLPPTIPPTMCLADAMTIIAKEGITIESAAYTEGDDVSSSFIEMMKSSINDQGPRAQREAIRIYKEFAPHLVAIRNRMLRDPESGKRVALDEKDIITMRAFANWAMSVLNIDAAIAAKFFDPEVWAKTDIGQMLLSGDEKQFLNACTIINFGGKFAEFLEFRTKDPKAEITDSKMLDRLNALSSIDVVHKEICDAFLHWDEEGERYSVSGLLETIIDGNIDFDTKQQLINKLFFNEDNSIKDGLYLSGVRGTPDMASSITDDSILTRMRKGRSYASQFKKSLYDLNYNMVTELEGFFSGKTVSFTEILHNVLKYKQFRVSMKPLSILMADMSSLTNHQGEKGSANDLSGVFYIMMDISSNGAQSSLDADTFNTPFNNYVAVDLAQNPDLLLKILDDGDFSIAVFEEDGSRGIFNRDRLFRECSQHYKDTGLEDDTTWFDVLKQVPNLVSYLGGIELSYASADGGIATKLSSSRSLLDYCKEYVARKNQINTTQEQNRREAYWEFEQATDELTGILMQDLRMYKYLFAKMSDEDRIRAMSGGEPSYSALWNSARELAQVVLALRMKGANGVNSESFKSFGGRLREETANRMNEMVQILYNGIVFDMAHASATSLNQVSRALNDSISNAMVLSLLSLGPISYSYNGEVKTIDLNSYVGTDTEGVLSGIFSNIAGNFYESANELIGIMFATYSALDMSTRSGRAKFENDMKNNLVRSLGLSEDEALACARKMFFEAQTAFANEARNYVGEFSNLILTRNDTSLFGQTKNSYEFLTRLKSLGEFCHDARFVNYADIELRRLAGEKDLQSYQCSEAEDLFKKYEALFDKNSGKWIGPNSNDVVYTDLENLIIRFANKAIAYSMSKHVMTTGRLNPYMLSDSTDIIEFIEEMANDERVSALYGKYHKVDPAIDVDDILRRFTIPPIVSTEESAYMNQFIEAVSAGRVVSEVGINGSEVMRTAGLAFVEEKRPLPFPIETTSGADLIALMKSDSFDKRTHIVMPDGTMAVAEDVENQIVEQERYQVLTRKINPHGIFYGPNPEPNANKYGAKYQTVLGMLNRLHMLGMENLVLKVRKAFGGDPRYVRNRDMGSIPKVKFSSYSDFIENGRTEYENFCEQSAKYIFENSEYRSDLEKAKISADNLISLVQMMTVGYTIEYNAGTDSKPDYRQTTVDVMHLYTGDLEETIKQLVGDKQIRSIELLVVPLQAISSKISKNVFVKSRDNGELTKDQLSQAAFEAMTNWDGYNPNSLSAVSIARKFAPLGRPYQSAIAERTPTELQKLIDATLKEKTHKTTVIKNRWFNAARKEFNRKWVQTSEDRSGFIYANESLLGEKTNAFITNVFGKQTGKPEDDFGVLDTVAGENWESFYKNLNSIGYDGNNIRTVVGGADNYVLCLETDPKKEEFKDAIAYAVASGQRLLVPMAKDVQTPSYLGILKSSNISLRVITNNNPKHIALAEIELSPAASDMRVLFEDISARRRNISTKDRMLIALLDEDGEYRNAGDASIWFKLSSAERYSWTSPQKVHDVDIRGLARNPQNVLYSYEELTEDDFKKLLALKPEEEDGWSGFKTAIEKIADEKYGLGYLADGDRYIKEQIVSYLSHVESNGDFANTSTFTGEVGGTCVGIVKAVPQAANEDIQYIPIFVPRSVKNVEAITLSHQGARVWLSYREKMNFRASGEPLTFKTAIGGRITDKGFAYVREDSIFPEEIDAIENYHTVSGRMAGRDEVVLYTNLSNYIYAKYLNLFFTSKANATGESDVDFSDAFKNYFANKEELFHNTYRGCVNKSKSESFWDLLLKDDEEAWSVLNLGHCGLSNGITARQRIKDAIRAAERYDIPVCQLFGISTYNVKWVNEVDEDGNPTGRQVPSLISISDIQNVPDIDTVFAGWAWDDICDFYAVVGQNWNLMASSSDPSGDSSHTKFNREGKFWLNDKGRYVRVIVDEFNYLGHGSEIETPGSAAAVGLQQRITKLMSYGYDSTTANFIKDMSAVLSRDPSVYLGNESVDISSLGSYDSVSMGGPLFDNYYEYNIDQELEGMIKDDARWQRKLLARDKTVLDLSSGTSEANAVNDAIGNLKAALGISGDLSLHDVHRLVNHYDGSTRGDLENDTIFASTFANHINGIVDNLKNGKLLITAKKIGDRYSVPVFDPVFLKYLCSISRNLDFSEYQKLMWSEEEKALELVSQIPDKQESKRLALQKAFAAMRKSWRDNAAHPWRDSGFFFGGLTVQEMTKKDTLLSKAAERLGFDVGAFDALSKLGLKLMENQRRIFEDVETQESIKTGTSVVNRVHVETAHDLGFVSGAMDNIVTWSRGMAVANLGVVAGNLAGRVVSQSFMDVLINIGAEAKIGPFAGKKHMSQQTIYKLQNNADLMDSYLAIREAGITGEDFFLGATSNSKELVDELVKMRENRSTFNKHMTKLFTLANGGNYAMKQQLGLFMKRLIHFIEAEPALAAYLEVNPNTGMMYIEEELLRSPAEFFLSCFAQDGRPELYACAMQAMNSAMTGDMAQRHWLASFLHHALKDRPLGRFIFSTTICKFPRYQFNLVDKVFNWFAPMSTLNYLLTHAAMEWDEKRAAEDPNYTPFNFQLDQRFVNAREAMAYDCWHMGPMVVASILLQVGNAIEPPDDEKKWGDPDEWLICGYRVGESWWLGDLLGAFLPSILFTKSCMMGKPTSSLLINGSLSACYGNPFLRAADVADTLANWDADGNLVGYLDAVEQYQNAEGGAPGFLDWISANSVSYMANLVTSTVTPSFVKELYRNSQEYEKSYKKIYKETATGKLSEAGAAGQTQNTTYFDAQIRKACRNNPFLAVVMDMLHSGDGTGYLLSEMPDVLYYDEAQMKSLETNSIKGLSEEEAEIVLSRLYYEIKDADIGDLQKSGFYLDKETLYALGSYMWDSYYAIEDEWNKLGAQNALSYTNLGNGNFDLGKQRYYELLNAKNEEKNTIKQVYNEKIKGSYLSQGPQQYRRYTTSYRTDSEGNIYATGFHRQGALPFLSAPGTIDNPEGTAGYENDFATISAVTGEPMGQRALVPIPSEYTDLPSFAGFSAKGDGEGYSGKWSRYSDSDSATTGASTGYSGSGYSSGGYSSGGGSTRRSSGSSGSSYVPNISAGNYTPNLSAAATGRSSRAYEPNFDYLRPNVNTKGSRNANR